MNSQVLEPRLHCSESPLLSEVERLLALLPVSVWAVIVFGNAALQRILISTLTVWLVDVAGGLLQKFLLKRPFPLLRFRGAVLGLLIALLSPSTLPIQLLLLADLVLVLVLQGLGSEVHFPLSLPAMAGSLLLLFAAARSYPLIFDSEGGKLLSDLLHAGQQPSLTVWDMLLGRMDGNMGEIASLLLLLGAGYLMIRRRMSWQIPVAGIVGGALVSYILAPDTVSIYYYVGAHLLSGGFLLVLLFIVSDRTCAPIGGNAGLLYGALFGVLAIYIRHKTNLDGSLIAALILSLLARPLDRLLSPQPFGGRPK
ncbi:MAG: RnfABCDGE type electron transport complex subunit D [Clostridia bacterium]|nr:RnfABCDGE type electron transport complex subunit D [Clostridia bacterium]